MMKSNLEDATKDTGPRYCELAKIANSQRLCFLEIPFNGIQTRFPCGSGLSCAVNMVREMYLNLLWPSKGDGDCNRQITR